MRKPTANALVVSTLMGVTGFALLFFYTSPVAAWGVFLMLWCNNLQRPR